MKIAFVILSLLDWALTATLLRAYGSILESNPIAASIYNHSGLVGLLCLKVSIVTIVLWIYRTVFLVQPKTANWLLWGAISATIYAVSLGAYANAVLFGGVEGF